MDEELNENKTDSVEVLQNNMKMEIKVWEKE
jgi:hypothetical protein